MTHPVERSVVKRNDIRIEVLAQGKGPLVVMIPSLGRPAEDFDHLAASLADAGYRALRPQPRGIGKSSGPMKGLTLHDFSRDVATVVEAHGTTPAVIAGHAFGNFVARTTAADFPRLVKAVVLLAATHTWPLSPELRDSINKSHQMDLPADVRLKHLQHVFFAPGNDARVWLDGWREDVMHMEREATEATPKPEWWNAGTAPVLDMQSECDPLSPPESRNCYVEQFGANRVTTALIPRAAHALLPEQPEAVAKAMLNYLKKIDHA
ncbi:MAG TPA: alpha/beta fold hydrolase [Burkholderiales bacterium]|nr:alpha/beta fold hydrolase [Burkholderiales bacterium]